MYIFTLAGCSAIDINAHQQDSKEVKNFIEGAAKANNLKIDLISKPLLVLVSMGVFTSEKLRFQKNIEAIQNSCNIIEFHLSELNTQEAPKL